MLVTVVQAGLTVHYTAEVGRVEGVRIDEVAGQDYAVVEADDVYIGTIILSMSVPLFACSATPFNIIQRLRSPWGHQQNPTVRTSP